MIYSREECDLIAKICERKRMDKTIYAVLDALPESIRSAADCQFSQDIMRCLAM